MLIVSSGRIGISSEFIPGPSWSSWISDPESNTPDFSSMVFISWWAESDWQLFLSKLCFPALFLTTYLHVMFVDEEERELEVKTTLYKGEKYKTK